MFTSLNLVSEFKQFLKCMNVSLIYWLHSKNKQTKKHQFFGAQPSLWSNSHSCTQLLETFVGKVMSLLFNTLPRFAIAFFPRSKHLLISWLQSPSAMILEPKKRKSVTVSTLPVSIWHEAVGLDAIILVFWMLNFKPAFSLSFCAPGGAWRKRQEKPMVLPGALGSNVELLGP